MTPSGSAVPHDGGANGGDGRPMAVVWVAAAAIVDDLVAPRRLLAARRTEPERLAGGWELPGGKIDPGESPLQALHREIAEELGVLVEVGPEVLDPTADGVPGWELSPPYRMRVWLARVVQGDPAPIEDHDAVTWLGPGRWLDLAWLPSNRLIVEELDRSLPGRRDR